jgi:hypothetical protein
MSATTQPSSSGTTAQAAKASVAETIGASRKITLFAAAGMIGSLNMNFMASAKVCRRPKAPTTLGPRRICTAAQILRSARIQNATDTITAAA